MRIMMLCLCFTLGAVAAAPPAFGANAVTEEQIMQDPLFRTLVHIKFSPNQYDAQGATGSNKRFESGDRFVPRFDVGTQRDALGIIARGIAENDSSMIDIGIRAIDYGFAHQGPEGNFGESGYAETAAFVAFTIRSYYVILDSPFASQYQSKLQAYVPKLDRAGHWLINPNNMVRQRWYQHREGTSNQVAAAGFCLVLLGRLTGNSHYAAAGDQYLQHVLDLQQPNGVFPELNRLSGEEGADSNYQVVSLDVFDWYLIYFPHSALSARVRAATDKGWAWEKSLISPSGEISDQYDVGAGREGETNFFGKKKVVSYPMVVIALIYRAHIAADQQAAQLAPAVFKYALMLYREHRLG